MRNHTISHSNLTSTAKFYQLISPFSFNLTEFDASSPISVSPEFFSAEVLTMSTIVL